MPNDTRDLKTPFAMAPQSACCVGQEAGDGHDCGCGTAENMPAACECGELAGEPCCGRPPGPASSPLERPGFQMCRFVFDFKETAAGPVPSVRTRLTAGDHLGNLLARLNVNRDDYKVAPGLYCAGNPGAEAPVLVTANYKLTFDTLRNALEGLDLWILVIDTRGINVWCAAGKSLFSTSEVLRMVARSNLASVVTHRTLILPQLAATGVCAQAVKNGCGFRVEWGPVRAADLKAFLENGRRAEAGMREVTFTLGERLVLIPVEISALIRPSLWILLVAFLLSGIGAGIFSPVAAWNRGIWLSMAYLSGIFAGAVAVPAFLPVLPGRAFALKGILAGLLAGILLIVFAWRDLIFMEQIAALLFTTAVSSFLAMNFTGSTPFTSPSGVEKEMRQAMPWQGLALIFAALLWVGAAFAG